MAKEDIGEIKFRKMRHCIGLLGLALPFVIRWQVYVVGNCDCLQDSISHYFYTVAAPSFIGILSALGLVLIFYPTPSLEDTQIPTCKWGVCKILKPNLDGPLTTIAGFCALIVVLFPTNSNSSESCAVYFYTDSKLRAGLHYTAAATMLLIFFIHEYLYVHQNK